MGNKLDNSKIPGVKYTTIKPISNPKGNIYHAIKKSDPTFRDFGEAYFTSIKKHEVKGWKKHKSMTLNLAVIKGNILFTIVSGGKIEKYTIGDSNYCRLVIPPTYWVCFEGIEDENIIINCTDMVHDPAEIDLKEFNGYEEDFSYWI